MEYDSLSKIYYKHPAEHNKTYAERFNSPLTRHFDFQIQEYNHRSKYPTFFCYTEKFAMLTEIIYRKHEDLLQALQAVPPLVMEQFILSSVVDEVRATSDIEGIHSTRKEIKEVVSGSVQSARFSSIVAKYKSILTDSGQISFKTCEDIRAFYDEFIHKEVTANDPTHKLDGDLFRRDSVDITSASGKILHRGVYPEERIIELLNVTLGILHDTDIPLLARVAIFHYFFEYIHPFYDGNGRTARFIVSYFLASRFHRLIALRLSVLIKKNKKKYYELFRETDSEWNCGDLTPFVLGFSEIVSATFDDISILLNNKIMQLTKYRQKLYALIEGDKLTKEIYEALLQSSVFFGGGISMERLMKVTGKSRNTVKYRLDNIPTGHVVESVGGGSKKIYKLNLAIV
ncbi:MAG: Fic family protein [Selenomonadaceae bacterium]|nr:Fic family protein [Selenomonadaceae bacterium]